MRRNSFWLALAFAFVAVCLIGCSRIESGPPPNSNADDSWLDGWNAKPGEPEASASGCKDRPADTGRSPVQVVKNRPAQEVAETAPQKSDIPADWTGAVVYHADYCKPCGRLIRDLQSRGASGWKTGEGTDVHFKLVDLEKRPPNAEPRIELLPTIIYYQNGKEVARVVGYGGTEAELNAILEKHPRAKKRMKEEGGRMSQTELIHPSAFILQSSAPVPPLPYQTSMTIGLFGFPLLSHVRQGAYDPTTGRCW